MFRYIDPCHVLSGKPVFFLEESMKMHEIHTCIEDISEIYKHVYSVSYLYIIYIYTYLCVLASNQLPHLFFSNIYIILAGTIGTHQRLTKSLLGSPLHRPGGVAVLGSEPRSFGAPQNQRLGRHEFRLPWALKQQ